MSKKFKKVLELHLRTLQQYVPIVARVHGGTHPEFHEVHKIFDQINEKIQSSGDVKAELGNEFLKLREITNDYQVPEDVCGTYEAVYNMLGEMDKAYH